MEETIEKTVVLYIGIMALLILLIAGLFYTSNYISGNESKVFKTSINQDIAFYITNNTMYILNKGSELSIGKGILNGYEPNNSAYSQLINLGSIKTGITKIPLMHNTTSATFEIYSNTNHFITTKNLLQNKLLTIYNMFSSTYVFINGKETYPIFTNYSTYYYKITSSINKINIFSNYFYINKTIFGNNFTLPDTLSTLNINFKLINGTTPVEVTNTIKLLLNNEYSLSNFNNGQYYKNISFPYAGNKIKLKYCYVSCTNSNYSIGNYTGALSSNMIFTMYKQSNPTFFINNYGISVPGEVSLFGINGQYSFNVSANGAKEAINNGNYIASFSTFNHFVGTENIGIANSSIYYLNVTKK